MHRILAVALTILLFVSAASADAVFQYTVEHKTRKGDSRAFLWIPPNARQVRGVVLAGMTLMERPFVKDPIIRKAAADQQLALVFLKSGLGSVGIQDLLDRFAEESGYRELSIAPLMFVGHSAGGPQAQRKAIRHADRCFGLMQYRGGVSWGGEGIPAGIPALMMVGQFDEFAGQMRDANGFERAWMGVRNGVGDIRSKDPRQLISAVVEPGAGHFAWSKRNAKYMALWMAKAADARIPETFPIDAKNPPQLRKIDPNSGWVTDLKFRETGKHEPAAVKDYSGDVGRTCWHFDKELAEAHIAYHEGLTRKDQFITWKDRHWVDAGARFFFLGMDWVGDGQTFEVHPVYADKVPGQYKGHGPRWHTAGQKMGNSGVPIRVKTVSGPMVPVEGGKHRFRMKFDALCAADGRHRATFMAYSPGNKEYRHTEHVGMMPRGFRGLKRGKDQEITFPQPDDLTVDGEGVELSATSSAGTEVEYYVAYGPAKIKDGKLVVADLPARAKLPVEVKVVAYQFGSGVEPKVKTARPVERTLKVTK